MNFCRPCWRGSAALMVEKALFRPVIRRCVKALIGFALLLFLARSASAAYPPNKALQLDGTNNYMRLPSNIFNSLKEATVEGWMRWDRLSKDHGRFFDFGDKWREMYVANDTA